MVNNTSDSSNRVNRDTYDRGIVPAETAARKEREGEQFKTTPTEAREASAATDDQTDEGSIKMTDGYTVDQEGLLNNYAIEPEMYYEVPGDARQAEEEAKAERAEELYDINQDEAGALTMDADQRGKGSGII
ncbi:hypothetical protein [Leptolyngbya sp. FACHB-17]|uniref:hypothetical protein n=1 Tax=unclassified Leptolyngbya TaxID=2650499 RepID=UPI00168028D6|nr:hypothetical protein [Leptolyngbya sp. FACHB-17]MBD2078694.1 hypothetical protein [Leptolyngbya sp. FACHB-17]